MEPKSRPILFSGAMVRAILDGTKTQTRRVIKPQPSSCNLVLHDGEDQPRHTDSWFEEGKKRSPYQPGDRLWVKEAWAKVPATAYHYDESIPHRVLDEDGYKWWAIYKEGWERSSNGWKSPRFMPRWASRIELEIVSVRVERLNDISSRDCFAEGACHLPVEVALAPGNRHSVGNHHAALYQYSQLWESINGKGSWALNPWVWVVEFRRVTP